VLRRFLIDQLVLMVRWDPLVLKYQVVLALRLVLLVLCHLPVPSHLLVLWVRMVPGVPQDLVLQKHH